MCDGPDMRRAPLRPYVSYRKPLSHLYHICSIYDYILAIYEHTWFINDQIWTVHDHIWSTYGHIWSMRDHTLTIRDHLWTIYDHKWIIHGHIRRPYSACRTISSKLSCIGINFKSNLYIEQIMLHWQQFQIEFSIFYFYGALGTLKNL